MGKQDENAHCRIHLVHREALVDVFHRLVGVVHRRQSLLVDVG